MTTSVTGRPVTRFTAAAVRADSRVLRAAHPLAYRLVRGLARLGPVVRVPGLGVVVSDAALAREVLLDTATYRKDVPGSSGALWTPVLGPSVLLNMEGSGHTAMRERLLGLFGARASAELCARTLGPTAPGAPLTALTRRLASGRPVDLADAARVLVGRMACALIGIAPRGPRAADGDGAACDDTARELVALGERVSALVRLSTRGVTGAQVRMLRTVLHAVTGPAGAAWEAGDPATVPGRLRAAGLDRAGAQGLAAALFLTGTETLVSFLPRFVALLADSGLASSRPDEAWVTEALRVTVPSPVMLRGAVAPGRLGGVAVRPGDRVLVATLSCCREADPATLRGLWFGYGPHACLGRSLALAQIHTALAAVLDGVGSGTLQVVSRQPARRVLIPAWRSLVVEVS